MLKVKVSGEVLEYSEDKLAIDDVKEDVRLVISAHHSENKTDRIWTEIKKWAEEWEDYPASGEYDGWEPVVAAVDEQLRIVPSDAATTRPEQWAKLVLKFKRAWVNVSNDATEGGHESASLNAVSAELHQALLAIHEEDRLSRSLNGMIPAVFTVTNDYFAGKYKCHQNAAEEIRDTLHAFDFRSLLNNEPARTTRERYMAAEWDELVFSSRL